MVGKQTRLGRLFGHDRRSMIVPIDQSLTSGPIRGLGDIRGTIRGIVDGQPDAVLMHRGPAMAGLASGRTGLIIHLSGGTQLSSDPQVKTTVCAVEEALILGADAVSVHISLGMGADRDNAALAEFGRVSSACMRWGMPLLAMMYVYGEAAGSVQTIAHAARVGCDVGADLIKVNYTGSVDSFSDVITSSYVPVVVAGGLADDDGRQVLKVAEDALLAGAAGVCVGRNIYQHAHPTAIALAMRAVVHEGICAEEAYARYVEATWRFASAPREDLIDLDDDLRDLVAANG